MKPGSDRSIGIFFKKIKKKTSDFKQYSSGRKKKPPNWHINVVTDYGGKYASNQNEKGQSRSSNSYANKAHFRPLIVVRNF